MSLITPKLLAKAFAENGTKNDIPEQQDPAGPNNMASYETGFPPVTMTPKAAGGKPPMGKDMNGVLYDVSNAARYSQAGMHYPFNQEFCDAIGGYPKGAVLLGDDGLTLFANTVEPNTTNPNTADGTGWIQLLKSDNIATQEDITNAEVGKIVDAAGFMGSFGQNLSASGWTKLPNGLILQWLSVMTSNTGYVTANLPIAFSTRFFQAQATVYANGLSPVVAFADPLGLNRVQTAQIS